VVATGDAAIGQLAWPSGQPLRCERLARIEPPGAVAIYPVAGAGHVVVAAMSGGDLVAWTLQPGHAAGQRVIARLDHPAGILAGCVASDGAHHLVVGDHRGAVLELAWRPGDRATRRELARFDAAIAGAAIHAEGTALHAAIATRDGAIIELSWQGRRVHRAVRARSGRPITSIAAYHAAVDDPGHGRPGETARGTYAVVATDDGNLRALWWATGDDGARHDVLPHVGAIAALDAFHGHDDTHRVLIATPTGELHELHWRVADAAGRVQD
jgi:hypothetical protein